MNAKNIVAGNWKMNTTAAEALALIHNIHAGTISENTITIIAAPYIHVPIISNFINENNSKIKLAVQNIHHELAGAFTGEISIKMIADYGVQYAIVGHSERRQYQQEDNLLIQKKVDALINNNMTPIFCCGEPLTIRNNQSHETYVNSQIEESLFHLSSDKIENIIIAYEPIWAIGTGVTASEAQAEDMHKSIRNLIEKKYGTDVSNKISILYGGSCNAQNAASLFSQANINGGLIGGASLKANDFLQICNSF